MRETQNYQLSPLEQLNIYLNEPQSAHHSSQIFTCRINKNFVNGDDPRRLLRNVPHVIGTLVTIFTIRCLHDEGLFVNVYSDIS